MHMAMSRVQGSSPTRAAGTPCGGERQEEKADKEQTVDDGIDKAQGFDFEELE